MPDPFADELTIAQDSLRKLSKALRSQETHTLKNDLTVPVSIFVDRRVGVLEATVLYLRDHKGLSYHEIAKAMNRDDRTIWTAYHQGKKKHGKA
jgi:hypothetical protein